MIENKLEIKSRASDKILSFVYEGKSGKMTFSICDAMGNILDSGKINSGIPNLVKVDRWKKGIYWIYITDQDRIIRQRFTRS